MVVSSWIGCDGQTGVMARESVSFSWPLTFVVRCLVSDVVVLLVIGESSVALRGLGTGQPARLLKASGDKLRSILAAEHD